MFNFLNTYAGVPGKTNKATVHQRCPIWLEEFFRKNCTKEDGFVPKTPKETYGIKGW
jgi:hypothetical protein